MEHVAEMVCGRTLMSLLLHPYRGMCYTTTYIVFVKSSDLVLIILKVISILAKETNAIAIIDLNFSNFLQKMKSVFLKILILMMTRVCFVMAKQR